MAGKLSTFDVCATFANGAREILAAREQAKQIHNTKDIRAAGKEVEVAVREYLVIQGHPYHLPFQSIINR